MAKIKKLGQAAQSSENRIADLQFSVFHTAANPESKPDKIQQKRQNRQTFCRISTRSDQLRDATKKHGGKDADATIKHEAQKSLATSTRLCVSSVFAASFPLQAINCTGHKDCLVVAKKGSSTRKTLKTLRVEACRSTP